jgi:hypothetical protein
MQDQPVEGDEDNGMQWNRSKNENRREQYPTERERKGKDRRLRLLTLGRRDEDRNSRTTTLSEKLVGRMSRAEE